MNRYSSLYSSRRKPAYQILRENEEARRAAHIADNKPSAAEIIINRARQTPAFAAGLANARTVADAFLALPEDQIVTALRAQGGWTAILTAAFYRGVDGATIPGSFGSDFLIASAVTATDLQAIRTAAIQAAQS